MSKINDLRTNKKYQIEFIDIISEIFPEKRTKYIETFLRIFFNENNEYFNEKGVSSYINFLSKNFNISEDVLKKYNKFSILFLYFFISNIYDEKKMKEFQVFCEFSEKKLINKKDLSRYKTIHQIIDENNHVLDKIKEKELKKQIKILYEDKDWLILRPFTFEASQKYGSNTQWCTTSKENKQQFINYTRYGVLIYAINKKSDQKYAFSEYSNSFDVWDNKDNNIFIDETKIPINIIENYIMPDIRIKKTNDEIYEEIKYQNQKINGKKISLKNNIKKEQWKEILNCVFNDTYYYYYLDNNSSEKDVDNYIDILKKTVDIN